MKMKMGLTLGLCALVMTLAAGWAAADNPVDGTITVTPIPTLSITVGGAIALGSVDVAQSTYPASGQLLTNLSVVGVSVKSKIGAASGWTASASAGLDTYALRNLAATTVPSHVAIDAETPLSGADAALTGAQTMGATGQGSAITSIWYRLDMPTSVSSAAAKTIKITYTATAL